MKTLDRAAGMLKALGHPMRLQIVLELVEGPRCVHELVDACRAPQPLVSQHLSVLRGANLVTATRQAREMQYAVADDHVLRLAQDALRHAEELEPKPVRRRRL